HVDAECEVGEDRRTRLGKVGELVTEVFAPVLHSGVVDHPRVAVDPHELRVQPLRRQLSDETAGPAADLEDDAAASDARLERLAYDLEPPPSEVASSGLLVLGRGEFEVCLQVRSYPSDTNSSDASI